MEALQKMDNQEYDTQISRLLCVCDICKTPFETVHLDYTPKSKVRCQQCDAEDVSVVRSKPYQEDKK